MSAMLRSQLRPLLGQVCPFKCASLACKYSSDAPNEGKDLDQTTQQQLSQDRKIEIRRQKPGDRPILQRPEDYLANYQAWRRQLPHEEDPSALTYSPDPRDRHHPRKPTNHGMGFSSDYLAWATRKLDFSRVGLMEYFSHVFYRQEKERQKFNPMRHGILGPDLAAAHFITFRGGRVKFVGHTEWWLDKDNLPPKYEEGYLIEKIDASSTGLNDEGITNLCNLYNLTDLNLTNNSLLDVYSFDKLYRQFRFSTCLKSLNVTNCINFCENSLAAIHRIPSLERVIITGTRAAKYEFTKLIVIFLHDLNPRLQIII